MCIQVIKPCVKVIQPHHLCCLLSTIWGLYCILCCFFSITQKKCKLLLWCSRTQLYHREQLLTLIKTPVAQSDFFVRMLFCLSEISLSRKAILRNSFPLLKSSCSPSLCFATLLLLPLPQQLSRHAATLAAAVEHRTYWPRMYKFLIVCRGCVCVL